MKAHKSEEEKPTIIQVMHILIKVACRRIFLESRIVPIRRGRPRWEGQTFSTSQATSVALLAWITDFVWLTGWLRSVRLPKNKME